MLKLHIASHSAEFAGQTVLVDPASISGMNTAIDEGHDYFTRVLTGQVIYNVVETPEAIARLKALWQNRFTEQFKARFGLDQDGYLVAAIGWKLHGAGLEIDVIDIDEQVEADVELS